MDQKRKNYIYKYTPWLLISLFLISFGYFFWYGDYILIFQEDQSLFLLSHEFIKEYFISYGGPLLFLNDFLTQFYIYPVAGSLIISSSLVLTGVVFYKINKQTGCRTPFVLFSGLIPPVLLLLMQTHYYHKLEYTLGILFLLVYFLLAVRYENLKFQLTLILFFPLFHYLTGFYAWIFFATFIFHKIVSGNRKLFLLTTGLLIVMAAISFFIYYLFLLPLPVEKFFINSLPLIKDSKHYIFFYILTGFIIVFPLIKKISESVIFKNRVATILSFVVVIILFAFTFFSLTKLYNSKARHVFKIQKYVFENQYDEAIELQETVYSKNQIGQYFYNVALSEKGLLCDRLFFGGQDFGVNTILLPMSREHLERGGYFYYATGLINEAHRWAYETMVVYGHRPQNIKMLIKTNLINGNYRMAEKYLNILERSVTYKRWAKEYKQFLYSPEKIKSHSELGPKLDLLPQTDFFIKIGMPQENINLLFSSNPCKPIFEYKMCEFMLMKDVEAVVNNIEKFIMLGYKNIPRHIEEAILVYYSMTEKFPELYGFEISKETTERFEQYLSSLSQGRTNMKAAQRILYEKFGNTYWYYLQFK